MHHGVTFNFGSTKVYSPAIVETCLSYNKDIWIAATFITIYVILHNCVISIDSYSAINKFCSLIIFNILINTVMLRLNCFVLILYLYISFSFSLTLFPLLEHYLALDISDTALKVSQSLYFYTTSISHVIENYYPRL